MKTFGAILLALFAMPFMLGCMWYDIVRHWI